MVYNTLELWYKFDFWNSAKWVEFVNICDDHYYKFVDMNISIYIFQIFHL